MSPFGVDQNGIIVNEADLGKISSTFQPLVDSVLSAAIANLSAEVESVYFYGSIVTGTAVLGKSDLDVILVLKHEPSAETGQKIKELESRLTAQHKPLVRGVALGFTSVEQLQRAEERYAGVCFLKHLCVRAHGADLTKDIDGFKPTWQVAQGFNGDIRQSLDRARLKVVNAESEYEVQVLSQALGKKLVRTGFSLVMPRLASWTTQLRTSYEAFAGLYPERGVQMALALQWAGVGTTDKTEVLAFIDSFGQWLANEFERIVSTNTTAAPPNRTQ